MEFELRYFEEEIQKKQDIKKSPTNFHSFRSNPKSPCLSRALAKTELCDSCASSFSDVNIYTYMYIYIYIFFLSRLILTLAIASFKFLNL